MSLVRKLIWNSLGGLVILFLAREVFRVHISYLWWPLILSALGGIPGALLALVLHLIGLI